MYAGSKDPMLQAAGRETFEAVSMLQASRRQPYTPADGAEYPRGRFGESLRQIAQLIKSGCGGGDGVRRYRRLGPSRERIGAGPSEGQLADLLRDYGESLAAFWQDMGDRMEDVAVVTMSEFGRTAHENGNRGTDHGHANCMFVMGGGVRAAKSTAIGRASTRAVLRRPRPGPDHRFSRRTGRIGVAPHGEPQAGRRLPGVTTRIWDLTGYFVART